MKNIILAILLVSSIQAFAGNDGGGGGGLLINGKVLLLDLVKKVRRTFLMCRATPPGGFALYNVPIANDALF